MYRDGRPPWDIGRPQPAVVALEEAGEIVGRVIDVGCGTGENALYLSGRGHFVRGVDSAPTAIARAQEKARSRGLRVEFGAADALALEPPTPLFDVALDCGLFHTLSDDERPRYVTSVARVVRPGGRMFVLCFSEHEPNWGGPRRVTQAEIRVAFARGWKVRTVREARFASNMDGVEGRAWLAAIDRTDA